MEYFTLSELTRSATAVRLGIDNTPPQECVTALEVLVDNVLNPLRRAWGRPVTVTSGYRCQRLNAAVGGARNSQHIVGEAADITAGSSADNRRLFQLIVSLGLPFDQLIDEHDFSLVHVSYSSRHRRQILKL